MYQYYDYLESINESLCTAPPARDNMPPTKVYPNLGMSFGFWDGFHILTGKKMPFYSIVAELICFIQGRTDVRDFDKLGCKVWWDNAYKWNIDDKGFNNRISKEEYINQGLACYEWLDPQDASYYQPDICNNIAVSYNLGRIYSAQWRNIQLDGLRVVNDQLTNMVDGLINKPFSRYHVLDAWAPAEMNSKRTSQPNCHVYFQATVVKENTAFKTDLKHLYDTETYNKIIDKYNDNPLCLYTHLTQRSCDAFLGVPFNITSYSLFTILLSIWSNTVPVGFNWFGVNNHIYSNHQDAVNIYLKRPILYLPKLKLDVDAIDTFEKVCDITTKEEIRKCFELVGYVSGDKIQADLSVG